MILLSSIEYLLIQCVLETNSGHQSCMGKSTIKTKKNKASVTDFINAVENPVRKRDAKTILKLMKEITGKRPKMWGSSIVGFDEYHYKSSRSKQEGDWMMVGFSPRKAALTIYIMPGYQDFGDLLKTLGPYKKGKSCLYLKNLDDIHMPTLKKIITKGYRDMKKKGNIVYQ